jgi:hypothetical protein
VTDDAIRELRCDCGGSYCERSPDSARRRRIIPSRSRSGDSGIELPDDNQPLDVDGHGGVTPGKGESQISVVVNNKPEAGAPLPVQYETFCGLLSVTV